MVKRLQTNDVSSAAENTFLEEIQTLQLASATCHRACRMLGCCKLDGDACIVMSLYPKSAAKRLSETEGCLQLQEVISIATGVLEGLAQLHDLHILHLDVKPGNVLLDDYGHAYLADFGISRTLRTLESCTVLTHSEGTPHYMAPEQVDDEFGLRGSHTDVWGFGTSVLHLATGHLPYEGLSPMQMASAMNKRRMPDIPNSLPDWLQQALKQCLNFDTAARPSVSRLLEVFKGQQGQLSQGQSNQRHSWTVDAKGSQKGSLDAVHVSATAGDAASKAQPVQESGLQLWQSLSGSKHVVGLCFLSESLFVRICGHNDLCEIILPQDTTVKFLHSLKPDLQQRACKSVIRMYEVHRMLDDSHDLKSCHEAILAAGALPVLVGLLDLQSKEQTWCALRLLADLVDGNSKRAEVVMSSGALPVVMALLVLRHEPAHSSDHVWEVHLLAKLAKASEACRDAIIRAGAVAVVVTFLNDTGDVAYYYPYKGMDPWPAFMDIVQTLASGSQACKDVIIRSGALIPLMEYFRTLLEYGDDLHGTMGPLLKLLQLLAHGSQAKHAILAAGAMEHLQDLMSGIKCNMVGASLIEHKTVVASLIDALT